MGGFIRGLHGGDCLYSYVSLNPPTPSRLRTGGFLSANRYFLMFLSFLIKAKSSKSKMDRTSFVLISVFFSYVSRRNWRNHETH